MPFDTRTTLNDIYFHIDLVFRFLENHDLTSLGSDLRTLYAVIRCLEVISEASRRLPPDLKSRHPDVNWRSVAAAGNFYRHQYEDVAAVRIWNTVHDALPLLKLVIDSEIANFS